MYLLFKLADKAVGTNLAMSAMPLMSIAATFLYILLQTLNEF